MHRSRLGQVLIDASPETFDDAVTFWSAALAARVEPDPEDPAYVGLRDHPVDVALLVQRLGEGASRLHLDIETDDIDAEVARLEALGATTVGPIERWVVMRDPAGLLFCVIGAKPSALDGRSTVWD
jgi:hypothetical protein